ncbi:MAG: hypothetical protein GQ532_06840 [Methylomarinum sp.]|nr:hypothetical protein [Methylomarinum sp.]
MKHLMRKSTIAISLILGSSAAFAQAPTHTVTTNNATSATLSKNIDVSKKLVIDGGATVKGTIVINANTMAVIDDKQLNYDNDLNTDTVGDPTFNATVNTVSGNAGNIGVNVTSGAFNQQDNAAAIAASDQSFLHGSTDAEIFSQQRLWSSDKGEETGPLGSSSDSGLTLNGPQFTAGITTIDGNSGNVGINISSGVSNQQKNNVAISTGVSKLAEASVAVLQEVTGMTVTLNTIAPDGVGGAGVGINFTSAVGDVTANQGNVGLNVASGIYNQQSNNLSITAVQ